MTASKKHVLDTFKALDPKLRECLLETLNKPYQQCPEVHPQWIFDGDNICYHRARKWADSDEWAMIRYIAGFIAGWEMRGIVLGRQA